MSTGICSYTGTGTFLLVPELVQVLLLVLDFSLVSVVVLVFAVMLTMILAMVPVLVPVLVLLVVSSTGTGIFIGSDSCISINTRTETFTETDYDTITSSILLVHKLSLVRTHKFINTARAYHQKGNGKSGRISSSVACSETENI